MCAFVIGVAPEEFSGGGLGKIYLVRGAPVRRCKHVTFPHFPCKFLLSSGLSSPVKSWLSLIVVLAFKKPAILFGAALVATHQCGCMYFLFEISILAGTPV